MPSMFISCRTFHSILIYLWCCLFARQCHGEGVCFPGCEGSLWFDLLRGMWAASDFAAQCSFIPNEQHASMCVRCWKGEKQTMKISSSFSFPFFLFQNLGLKFRVTVHQSYPLTEHSKRQRGKLLSNNPRHVHSEQKIQINLLKYDKQHGSAHF